MKITSKKFVVSLVLIGTIFLLLLGATKYFLSIMVEQYRYESLKLFNNALKLYVEDEGRLPDFDNWCDILIDEADLSKKDFLIMRDPKKGECGYALNENLRGKEYSELDEDLVLVFEAKGPWNLYGGPELADDRKSKKVGVLLISGKVLFVSKDQIDNLKWKP